MTTTETTTETTPAAEPSPAPVWVTRGRHHPIDPGGPVPPLWLAGVAGGRANWWVDTAKAFFADNWLTPGVPWPVPGAPGWALTLHEVGRVGWEYAALVTLERGQQS